MVKSSADSLLSLLNDILDLSKIEAGKLDFETIDFNLRDTLEDAIKGLSSACPSEGDRAGVPSAARCSRSRTRRSHAPAAGGREPGGQRHQVHGHGRSCASCRPW